MIQRTKDKTSQHGGIFKFAVIWAENAGLSLQVLRCAMGGDRWRELA
jgi:hypothetical protein